MDTIDRYKPIQHSAIYGLNRVIDEAESKAAPQSARDFLEKTRRIVGKIKPGFILFLKVL